MTQIILLSGKQGSGKTTLSDEIFNFYSTRKSWEVFRLTFAGVIYKMHDACLSILKDCGISPSNLVKDGNLLQLLGTEWGRRHLGEDIWVRALRGQILKISEVTTGKNNLIVVSDCRFKNEFDAIPEALRVRLECDREIRKSRCSMWRENDLHPSEVDLDEYAASKRFDLTLFTDTQPVNECLHLVLAQIDKNSWREKR